jgi:hypothetical protein
MDGMSPNNDRYTPAKRPKPLHPQAMQIDPDEFVVKPPVTVSWAFVAQIC